MAINQALINTALAITSALTTAPAPLGIALAIIAGALGTIQVAAIAATPIPKFELGTDDHKGGLAEVAEKRPEVISEPGKKPYIVRKRSILNLPKHTKVTPSIGEYKQMMADQAGGYIQDNTGTLMNFQNSVNYSTDKELIREMQLTRKAIQKNKPLKHQPSERIDLNHEIFRANNITWDS
ncbi:MAG: hypothetical protein KUG67_03215 [Proteobacteria bacterium]|nr:hypothetical protein [Pseudomonadota bacterium]